MRRLLCLLALTLVLDIAVAQSFVATAATSKVQQRVQEVLQSGGRLTPEALLQKTSTVSAAAYDGKAHDAANKKVQIAAVNFGPQDNDDDVETASWSDEHSDDDWVRVAAKDDVRIKWATTQETELTLDDRSEKSGPGSLNESADVIKRISSSQDAPSQPQQQQPQQQQPQQEQPQQSSSKQGSQDSAGITPKDAELLQRLNTVDWESVLEEAAREAEAEERAAAAKINAVAEARHAEYKRRIEQAEAERQRAETAKQQAQQERQALTQERKEALQAITTAAAEKERAEEVKRKAAEELLRAEAAKIRAAEEHQKAEEAKQRVAEEVEQAAAVKEHFKNKAEEEMQRVEAARQHLEYMKQEALHLADEEESYKAAREARQQYSSKKYGSKQYSSSKKSTGGYKSQDKDSYGYKGQEKDSYNEEGAYGYGSYDSEYGSGDDYTSRVKVTVQEKNRSKPRYFPGGGMYSFTSELTCTTEQEAEEKVSGNAIPLVTPRMTKTTVGICEWTVAENTATQINKNVFLLGNGWATCTFLPVASHACDKPISGGLTLTIQALMYQFAQPQGVREAELPESEAAPATDVKAKKAAASASVSIAAINPWRNLPKASSRVGAAASTKVAVTNVAPRSTVAVAAPGRRPFNGTMASVKAVAQAVAKPDGNAKYLMDVDLQNVFLGLITGAHGPKKSHKYKQGALQYVFGPPPETNGKSYAVETQMLPTALGGPSVKQLQEGMVPLVPGTYQFVFDEE